MQPWLSPFTALPQPFLCSRETFGANVAMTFFSRRAEDLVFLPLTLNPLSAAFLYSFHFPLIKGP